MKNKILIVYIVVNIIFALIYTNEKEYLGLLFIVILNTGITNIIILEKIYKLLKIKLNEQGKK